jgi:hypothetical protein
VITLQLLLKGAERPVHGGQLLLQAIPPGAQQPLLPLKVAAVAINVLTGAAEAAERGQHGRGAGGAFLAPIRVLLRRSDSSSAPTTPQFA